MFTHPDGIIHYPSYIIHESDVGTQRAAFPFRATFSADSFLLPAMYQLSTDSHCKDTKLKTESQVFWDIFSDYFLS